MEDNAAGIERWLHSRSLPIIPIVLTGRVTVNSPSCLGVKRGLRNRVCRHFGVRPALGISGRTTRLYRRFFALLIPNPGLTPLQRHDAQIPLVNLIPYPANGLQWRDGPGLPSRWKERRPDALVWFYCQCGISYGSYCWRRFGPAVFAGASGAAELLLKDGRLLRGKMGEVSELCETPTTQKRGGDNAPLVTFLDDNLRRTYFSTRLIKEVRPEENRPLEEKFTIWQHAKHGGGLMVKSVGLPVAIGEFDEFGRRNFTMATERGTLTVTQGITELTPQWAKVEASALWDMRIATSSIPRDTLEKILWKQIDRERRTEQDRSH